MKRFTTTLVLTTLLTLSSMLAQETKIDLPTKNNSSSFTVVGTDADRKMKFFADGGFYLSGDLTYGTIPSTGAGTRLMWYPKKAAYRVGYVDGTQWDDNNIGTYSMGMGYNTTASGTHSTALGLSTTASGGYSTAMGRNTTASGDYSTAMGWNTTASGDWASIAMGYNATASGSGSIAMGNNSIASGMGSIAIGNNVSTNGKMGSFAIGDINSDQLNAYQDNMMIARFMGGYTFYSWIAPFAHGVTLPPAGNSWASASDSTKKENVLLADGEYFLNSISKLRLGSWNYIGLDAKDFRHYGPMAQEIFHYFGKDEYGTIGCDTLLATADMDGIMMIALQALEVRSKKLEKDNEDLRLTINDLRLINEEQEVRGERLETSNTELATRLSKLEELLAEIITNNEKTEIANK